MSALPTACEYRALLAQGQLSAESLATQCLDAIASTDAALGAWAFVDREQVLADAKACDERRRRGLPLGALHGLPVGLKDIIDTAGQPCERGSAVYQGRVGERDATLVSRLREAGAVILGKTVTTELAFMHPAGTRNPHNLEYSPGGSSSGSAASVAAGQVPLAIGSQTNGSVIRPASYCGIYGYKPSYALVSRAGVLQTSATLDHIGVFARDAADIALLVDALAGFDREDAAMRAAPVPRLLDGYRSDVPIEPTFAWFDMPYDDRYTATVRAAAAEVVDALGGRVEVVPTPASFSALIGAQQVIHEYEIYRCLSEARQTPDKLSDTIRSILDRAGTRSDTEYQEALGIRAGAIDWFERFFHDVDAVLTPSATGEAPRFGQGTGDPICSTVWTLAGLPCISLPLLQGDHDLPLGIQLVGARGRDDRLMRTTRWLLEQLTGEDAGSDHQGV